MPQGRVAVNAAAWLRYSRCSRILDDSAEASVSAVARDSWAGPVTVTVTYRPSRLTPAPRASSSAAWRARAGAGEARGAESPPGARGGEGGARAPRAPP